AKLAARLRAAGDGNWRAFIAAQFRSRLWSMIERRLVLYRWRPRQFAPEHCPFDIRRIASVSELPPSVFEDANPLSPPRDWYEDRFADGAVLWVGLDRGRAASCVWLIRGADLPGWYRPLKADDKVIYAVVTPHSYRGRGAAPAVVRKLLTHEQQPGADIHVDCKVWNKSARRAFEKVGFEPIATVSPRIWRSFAREAHA
ncbi:MAG: GNAT family N-acetyltransferase, partial [Novosphingobium sp.]|nr:GNAT family N-acetyltransferase [Novosphingobium sp.]